MTNSSLHNVAHGVSTPDFRTYPTDNPVIGASMADRWVSVRWADGSVGRFHFIWLRDNAADEASIDPDSRERTFDILDLDENPRPDNVSIGGDGALLVDWPGHAEQSHYHPGWLRAYCYDIGEREQTFPQVTTWDASFSASLPKFDAQAVTQDAPIRLAWLSALRRFGVTVIEDSPIAPDDFQTWIENLLLIRDMNWGKYFDVIYEPDGAYISNKGVVITPHVDAPTREHMPGIQIFHCVENTVAGGGSCWVDAFNVAETIRRDHPRDFKLLSTVPWGMANRNADTEYHSNAPIISVTDAGELIEVRDTHWLREPLLTEFDLVEPLYAAYRRYASMTRDPSNQIHHRLVPGETAIIDNRRILHAREAYASDQGHRHMYLCYSEREEVDSAISVLERDLAREADRAHCLPGEI